MTCCLRSRPQAPVSSSVENLERGGHAAWGRGAMAHRESPPPRATPRGQWKWQRGEGSSVRVWRHCVRTAAAS
eukprot:7389702-Prymnesium_polylepis.2